MPRRAAHGDLKENAEYHAAKEEQGFIEGRIRELETQLSNAEVIDVTRLVGNTKVLFGATVSLLDEADGKASRYQIVGEYEADMKQGLISITSPLARALIGKVEGDVASFAGARRREEHGNRARRVPLTGAAVAAGGLADQASGSSRRAPVGQGR